MIAALFALLFLYALASFEFAHHPVWTSLAVAAVAIWVVWRVYYWAWLARRDPAAFEAERARGRLKPKDRRRFDAERAEAERRQSRDDGS